MIDDGTNLMPLPSKTDSFFNKSSESWNDALLDSYSKNWSVYTVGYKNAGDILVERVIEKGHSQDLLVFPIMFLYRQYLELALKGIIRDASKLLKSKPACRMDRHNLPNLWDECYRLLVELFPNDSEEELKNIGRLMIELSKIDESSFAFRYPENNKQEPTLNNIDRINLRNVKGVIEKISILLCGADAMIDICQSASP